MNPRLDLLQPYPFERLRALLAGATPPAELRPISLGLGEPQHATPALIKDALTANLSALGRYPQTLGLKDLRVAIAEWIARRYVVRLDPDTQVIPLSGSREGIFSLAQATVDPGEADALVVCPNPFYQVYEGSTLLAGAKPYFVNALASRGFRPDWDAVPEQVWKRTRLVYTCSPNNPIGRVMPLEEWRKLFELADRHGFVLVSDECYSEIYFDEARPPLGALTAAKSLGREGFKRLIVMGSLSKRSSAPGLRSGFAAGDKEVIARYLQYRTYFGSAMSNAVQLASIAAWRDEKHVIENRRLYREKFAAFYERVNPALPLTMPDAAFYFWADVRSHAGAGDDDAAFARDLFAATHVTVLPGSYISREAGGIVPGRGFVRMALVSTVEDAIEAAERVRGFAASRVASHAGAAAAR